ncbi:MAG: non-canonical purine NTP pyrophosphatase [bacterium]|nr:non-canonical purine NTP pyrophosphatase [bacterium]
MKKIYFVTGNAGKVLSLQNRLPKDIQIEQVKIELPEIQHHDIEEIVRQKAKFAYEQLKKPLIVQDSAFHIEALNNFPGPYIKYINETIGAEGILKLMKGEKNRTAYFKLALAYTDDKGKITVFTNAINKGGKISNYLSSSNSTKAWSGIWRIYIPYWAKKTLSELTDEEIDNHEKGKQDKSEFAEFAKWIGQK